MEWRGWKEDGKGVSEKNKGERSQKNHHHKESGYLDDQTPFLSGGELHVRSFLRVRDVAESFLEGT